MMIKAIRLLNMTLIWSIILTLVNIVCLILRNFKFDILNKFYKDSKKLKVKLKKQRKKKTALEKATLSYDQLISIN